MYTYYTFTFLLAFYPFDKFLSDNSMIDIDHLQRYPFCGSMDYTGNIRTPTARVVNSKIPEEIYRWTVLQIRRTYDYHQSDCSGTIITDR